MDTDDQAVDPICGMQVDPDTALSSSKDSETFYFCSRHCQEKFESMDAPVSGCCQQESSGEKVKPRRVPTTIARCAKASKATNRETVRNAEWHWNRLTLSSLLKRPSILAQCIQRLNRINREPVRSAAWTLSLNMSPQKPQTATVNWHL